jgi:hypothetical protein
MFEDKWLPEAEQAYEQLREGAKRSLDKRLRTKGKKSSKAEGLFKQVHKTIELLKSNPRHTGLQTREFHSLLHPYSAGEKIFEAGVQHRTPGAYRVFWCYGPESGQITIIAITPHP